jgi:hypothetical protein
MVGSYFRPPNACNSVNLSIQLQINGWLFLAPELMHAVQKGSFGWMGHRPAVLKEKATKQTWWDGCDHSRWPKEPPPSYGPVIFSWAKATCCWGCMTKSRNKLNTWYSHRLPGGLRAPSWAFGLHCMDSVQVCHPWFALLRLKCSSSLHVFGFSEDRISFLRLTE